MHARRWLLATLLAAVATVTTLALLELGVRAAVATGLLRIPVPPGLDEPFWVGDDARFGVWRRPNARFEHETACFDVVYETNSIGARDAERPRDAEGRRILVLGDSFTDGWGVEVEERFTNRLERETGVPHLNFAMPHFGPYQSFLAYRDLAKEWQHDEVWIGVLPVNDFVDLDYQWGREKAGDYLYRYRPYLVPDAAAESGWRRVDWREPAPQRFLRRSSYLYSALQTAWRSLRPPDVQDPAAEPPEGAERIVSFFYDAEPRQLAILEESLRLLAEEAGDRPVTVVLIPGLRDLRRHAFSGPDPLTPQLEAFGREHGLRVVSLLAPMAEATRQWSRYYLPCDYHLGPYGHETVARLLREATDGSRGD